uniref:SJCHGC02336 protein n=1 Tax=Schistosoma japonicum TaxID=6182 RepID=Q5DED1_SCHJA|nr:SJCHGC02336 protein [Schistosoma japonicum]
MSNDRTIAIPVNHDTRTFEQYRRDFLKDIEKFPNHNNSILPYHDEWFNEVDDWIKSSWRRWDDEMKRIRNGMLQLMPLDNFGLNKWDLFDSSFDPNNLMRQMEQRIQEIHREMGITDAPFTGSLNDFLKDAYEVGKDGKVHFKVRFDVKGFSPEDINVSTTDNRVVVCAKKVTETGTSKSSRQFCRMIELPQSIEQTKLDCRLTNDGVLILEAPVKSTEHKSVTFNDKRQLAIRPTSYTQSGHVTPSKALVVKGVTGPTIIDEGFKGKRLHVEIPIDPMYKSEDLCIHVDPDRIVVSGRRSKSDSHSASWKKIHHVLNFHILMIFHTELIHHQ